LATRDVYLNVSELREALDFLVQALGIVVSEDCCDIGGMMMEGIPRILGVVITVQL